MTIKELLSYSRNNSLHDMLASCFADEKINQCTGDRILAILRTHSCLKSLPKSMKTLLNTPRQSCALLDVPPGKYLHFGLDTAINRILEKIPSNCVPLSLEIDFSTDGASLDNSGSNEIWPLQCRIANIKNSSSEVIGIYKGAHKPQSAMNFLGPFVQDASKIIREGGLIYLNKKLRVTLRAFIADAPARAFILNHMGHNSRYACSKCKVIGWSVRMHMTFPGIDHPTRTDVDYHRRLDEDHHKDGVSPLSLLPMGMVTQVPFEYMHLVCLGVVKRMLRAWVNGTFSMKSKLSGHQLNLISGRLERLAELSPKEFARPPRSLNQYIHYKTTEFRQFLLYTGPVVLKSVLADDIYKHFIILHAAVRILTSESSSETQLLYAKLALRIFVRQCENIYGSSFVSYNVHGLLHIVDDVKMLGPVDAYSAFPYENNMRLFRRCCKKPSLHLQQIANRYAEQALWYTRNDTKRHDAPIVLLGCHANGPLPANIAPSLCIQYRVVKSKKFSLSSKPRDRCVIMKNKTICMVYNIVVMDNKIKLIVKKFDKVTPFYDVAIPSSLVGYYKCSTLEKELTSVKFADIDTKAYLMPHWSRCVLDNNGRELLDNGVYVVAAMSCAAHY